MFQETRKYRKLVPSKDGENTLRIEIGYQLGGMNWYNGDEESRGYYLYCTPCERKHSYLGDGTGYTFYTETLGKGGKLLLKAVGRQSQKAKQEAIEIARKKEDVLVGMILSRYGLKLAEV